MEQFTYLETKTNSDKLHLDKYYSSNDLSQRCIDIARRVLKGKKISEVIDPSAGNGSFSSKIKNCIAYDIEPEGDGIIKQDFLTLNLPYREGRLFITNPPFGVRMLLVKKFFKKCVSAGDYIGFVLPISQLNNEYSMMYEFDLIHSEDLGEQDYSGRKIHCCFNVYQRPESGILNSMPVAELQDVEILREHSKGFHECKDFDLRMCYWGNASAGKILNEGENYSAEWKITVKNKELKQKVIDAITRADWKKEIPKVAMLKIQKYHLVNYLKREIPEIQ